MDSPVEGGSARPVGIMDSGAGGLTVLGEVRRLLPGESIIYFADAGRLPYGPRPAEEVRNFVFQVVRFLEGKGSKAIVLACNTATAHALDHVRRSTDVPVLGVIEAGVRALTPAPVRKVGLVATEGTVRSGAYQRAIRDRLPGVEVVAEACPDFVTLVEAGLVDREAIARSVEYHTRIFRETGVDALILGCTHFPLLRPWLESALPGVRLVDPARKAAEDVRDVLKGMKLARRLDECAGGQLEFYTTGSPEKLKKQIEVFLSLTGVPVRHVDPSML